VSALQLEYILLSEQDAKHFLVVEQRDPEGKKKSQTK
jgi:hypothetical protein